MGSKIDEQVLYLFRIMQNQKMVFFKINAISDPNNWNKLNQKTNLYASVLLTVFHILFVMLVWSFFQAMTTDPGQVPVFWGFHFGDSENKRRRYCLMCNVFKPERCHHCSACNRCVLNMDHHCSINNWYQIFGTNKWLWPFPVFCGSGKPLGDGIYWREAREGDEGFSSQKKGESIRSNISPIKQFDGNQSNNQSSISGQKLAQPQYQNQFVQKNQGSYNVAQSQIHDACNPNNATVQMYYGVHNNQNANQNQQPQNIPNYPQSNQFFAMQNQEQQIIGDSQNRIIMHEQDRDQIKKNLDFAIFNKNHLQAQYLNQQPSSQRVVQSQQQQFNQQMERSGGFNQQQQNQKYTQKNTITASTTAGRQGGNKTTAVGKNNGVVSDGGVNSGRIDPKKKRIGTVAKGKQ
eukprot:403375973